MLSKVSLRKEKSEKRTVAEIIQLLQDKLVYTDTDRNKPDDSGRGNETDGSLSQIQ